MRSSTPMKSLRSPDSAGFASKVNLIVWNPGPGIPYHQPKDEDVARFQQRLINRGVPAFIRRPKRPRHLRRLRPAQRKTTS